MPQFLLLSAVSLMLKIPTHGSHSITRDSFSVCTALAFVSTSVSSITCMLYICLKPHNMLLLLQVDA